MKVYLRIVWLLLLMSPIASAAPKHYFPPLSELLNELPNVASVLKAKSPAPGREEKSGSLSLGTAAMVFVFSGKSFERLDNVTIIIIRGARTTEKDSIAAFTLSELLVRRLFRLDYQADEVVSWIADDLTKQSRILQVGGTPNGGEKAFFGDNLTVTTYEAMVGGNMLTHINLSLYGSKKN